MNTVNADLRGEVRRLAEEAFRRKLISGYGDGENSCEYQIIYKGKTRHLSLEYAQAFLSTMILLNSLPQEAV